MSLRYYWISALIIIVLTITIGFATKRNSRKDIIIIFAQVSATIFILVGLIFGLAKLLVLLGIAEEGFVL